MGCSGAGAGVEDEEGVGTILEGDGAGELAGVAGVMLDGAGTEDAALEGTGVEDVVLEGAGDGVGTGTPGKKIYCGFSGRPDIG